MKIINSKTDKFLIQCVELDLYDILYDFASGQITNAVLQTDNLLKKYKSTGAIKDYHIVKISTTSIEVDIYIPRKIRIKCQIP